MIYGEFYVVAGVFCEVNFIISQIPKTMQKLETFSIIQIIFIDNIEFLGKLNLLIGVGWLGGAEAFAGGGGHDVV